ncbi:MAG: FlgD immunoglobulin-like domain containing protein [Candidatus Neomarinimicrobiota bacterium]
MSFQFRATASLILTSMLWGQPTNVDWATEVHPIFQQDEAGCAIGNCHGGGTAGLTINSSATTTYNNIVNRASGCQSLDYVEPFDSDASYLYWKTSGAPGICGGRMPANNPTYFSSNPGQLELIRVWIDEGALAEADLPPVAPQILAAEAGDGEVTLTWGQNTEGDFGLYRVYGDTIANPTAIMDSTTGIADTMRTLINLVNGTTYHFRVTSVDAGGSESGFSNEVAALPTATVAVEGGGRYLPTEFSLEQNHPNPFNPATTLSYGLPSGAQVKLTVYDMRGREVATLEDAWQSAGRYQLRWDGNNRWGQPVGTGVYFARLRAGEMALMRKMVLLR